jgi:AcrR family transcriptional regulator
MARTKKPTPARKELLQTANDLFYADGIRAVGVNTITSRSGVALMTLYNHFGSKDELVVTYLRERSDRFREWLHARLAELAGTPNDRVLGVIDAFADDLAAPRFRGCAFVNATVEFPDRDHPVHTVVAEHKRAVREILARHVDDAGFENPDMLAAQLMVVIEGLQVTALLDSAAQATERARAIVIALVSQHSRRR